MRLPYRITQTLNNIPYRKYRQQLNKNDNRAYQVIFDMTDLVPDRRLTQIWKQFNENGYRCCLYYSSYKVWFKSAFLQKWRHSECLFDNGIINCIPKNVKVIVCKKIKKMIPGVKYLQFDDEIMDKIPDLVKEPFYFPILFHPNKLSIKDELFALDLITKDIGCVFVGNSGPAYDKFLDEVHTRYGTYTRNESLNILRDAKELIFEPENENELYQKLNNGELINKVLLITKFTLQGDKYWNILKRSKFHIWTCGVIIPFCHNQIESAACGCVPITDFSYIFPGLTESNCITYEEIEELVEKVKFAVNLSPVEYGYMTQNIKEWYLYYWSFATFSKKVKEFLASSENSRRYYSFKELPPYLEKIEKITGFHF